MNELESPSTTVMIPHPTEELKLIKLQKSIIEELFEENRIIYRQIPLWIHVPDSINAGEIVSVIFSELELSEKQIFIPVEIITKTAQYISKLTLVSILGDQIFTGYDRQKLSKIKQPVRLLKIFRLGIEKELSSNSKCITDSKWIKLHYSASTIQ